jgi:hypothetical protein
LRDDSRQSSNIISFVSTGSCCFGGEESAGASFLKRGGLVWTTDKDSLILGLLAAEIIARTGKDPGEHYNELTAKFGTSYYTRIDAPATPEQKNALKKLSPEAVTATELSDEAITAKLTRAPGNDAPIGGLNVVSASGWFAARLSGTEHLYKLYAESLKSADHRTGTIDFNVNQMPFPAHSFKPYPIPVLAKPKRSSARSLNSRISKSFILPMPSTRPPDLSYQSTFPTPSALWTNPGNQATSAAPTPPSAATSSNSLTRPMTSSSPRSSGHKLFGP